MRCSRITAIGAASVLVTGWVALLPCQSAGQTPGGGRGEAPAPIQGIVTVPHAAFRPASELSPIAIDDFRGATGVSGIHDLFAPVLLPHGATVTNIECVFYDASSVSDLFCLLRWGPLDGLSVHTVGSILGSSGEAGLERVALPSNRLTNTLVDNANRIYWVQVAMCFVDTLCVASPWEGENTAIKAMVITYTMLPGR